jgi:hypothetical protein
MEKGAIAGVVETVTDEYQCTTDGQPRMVSLTFLYGTACEIQKAAAAGKQSYIYQLGDHDPSGELIPEADRKALS